jgi:hypothetical protein
MNFFHRLLLLKEEIDQMSRLNNVRLFEVLSNKVTTSNSTMYLEEAEPVSNSTMYLEEADAPQRHNVYLEKYKVPQRTACISHN